MLLIKASAPFIETLPSVVSFDKYFACLMYFNSHKHLRMYALLNLF